MIIGIWKRLLLVRNLYNIITRSERYYKNSEASYPYSLNPHSLGVTLHFPTIEVYSQLPESMGLLVNWKLILINRRLLYSRGDCSPFLIILLQLIYSNSSSVAWKRDLRCTRMELIWSNSHVFLLMKLYDAKDTFYILLTFCLMDWYLLINKGKKVSLESNNWLMAQVVTPE